jgi:hypothetical protein
MAEYPPYVNAYGSLPKLFSGIKAAAVPAKVTQDFLETVLELKSSSHRAYIPLLKKLGFVDSGNAPTQAYKDFRDEALSGTVMAERLREAYRPLFAANEYAWKLPKTELQGKIKNITGAGDDDPNIPAITGTFLELAKLATWEGAARPRREGQESTDGARGGSEGREREREREREGTEKSALKLSYTINLNLPATTEIEVFNAIFKSLRENLLTQI